MKNINKNDLVDLINLTLGNVIINEEQLDDNLETLGLDSLKFISLIIILEEELGIVFPDSKLVFSELNTVNKIYNVLISLNDNI